MMPTRHTRIPILAATLLVLSVALAACGGSSSSNAPTSSPGTSVTTGGAGKVIDVTLANFSVTLAGGSQLSAGAYTFNTTNNSGTGHDLSIDGPGLQDKKTPTFTSGTKSLTVTLTPGTYTFYCSIHKTQGMQTTVTVK